MSQPEVLRAELGEETVSARVGLGGDDALFVTPSRLVVYRAEGLLSDESVESYPHGAERITVSEGRRKASVDLDYGLDGDRTLQVPVGSVDEVLHHVLAGILRDTLADDERVTHTFRFSELTLVVTDDRVVKHVGTAVWDEEFEQFSFADVTDLTFEEGSLATSVVLTLGDRQQRFKTPNDSARRVREAIESALFDYHDVRDVEALRRRVEREAAEAADAADAPEADAADAPEADAGVDFGDGPDPLSTEPAAVDADAGAGTDGDAGAVTNVTDADAGGATDGEAAAGDDGFDGSGFQPAASDGADGDGAGAAAAARETAAEVADLRAEVAALRATVEAQGERLDRQNELVEQLVTELRQGR